MKKPVIDLVREKQAFIEVLPGIINSVIESPKIAVPEVKQWIQKILEYILPDGSRSCGFAVSVGYQMMEDPQNITEESLHSARVLGWCLEMALLLMADDILDGSTTRHGKPCWHQLPNVGFKAINDALFIQLAMHEVLNKTFRSATIYREIIQLFHKMALDSAVAEHCETHKSSNKKIDLDSFTLDRFHTTSMHKGAFYSYQISVQLAMLLLKNNPCIVDEQITEICLTLGRLKVIKNDYSDVYGEVSITGKAGSDIPEGKLTWLAVTALDLCSDAQREIFSKYFGSKEPEHVKRIKMLYDDLQMPLVFEQTKIAMEEDLTRRIDLLPSGNTKTFFTFILRL